MGLPALLAGAYWLLARHFRWQGYGEAIAGLVASWGVAESCDVRAPLAFVGGCAIVGLVLQRPSWQKIGAAPHSARRDGLYWLAGLGLAASLHTQATHPSMSRLLLLLPLAALGVGLGPGSGAAAWRRASVSLQPELRLFFALAGSLLFCGPALGVLCSRGLPAYTPYAPLAAQRLQLLGLAVCGAVVLLLGSGAPAHRRQGRRLATAALVLMQALLPAGILFVLPPPCLQQGSWQLPMLQGSHLGPALRLLFVVLAAATCWRNLRLSRRAPQAFFRRPLAPAAIFGALCLLAFTPGQPQAIAPDDYHFGEALLPYDQWRQFGRLPFVDFMPAHGLSEFFYGALGEFFYEPNVAGTMAAMRLLQGSLTLLAFWGLMRFLGPLCGGLVGLGTLLYHPEAAATTWTWIACAAHAVAPGGLRRPRRWLLGWTLLAPLLAASFVVQGTGMVLATLPLVGLQVRRLVRREGIGRAGRFCAALLIWWPGVLLVFAPLRQMFGGLLGYLLHNAGTNAQSFGLPMAHNYYSSAWRSLKDGLLLNAQLLFLPPVGYFVARLAQRRLHRPTQLNRRLFHLGIIFTLLACTTMGYHMGRSDPPRFWGRPGQLSLLLLFCGLPTASVLLWRRRRPELLAASLLFLILGVDSVGALSGRLWQGADARSLAIVQEPESRRLRAGAATFEPGHRQMLAQIDATVGRLLTPDEQFAVWTNRSSVYYFTRRAAFGPIAANYNVANAWLEGLMLTALQRRPPQLFWLGPEAIRHDGLSPALRTRALFRAVARHYEAVVDDDGRGWMVPRQRRDLQRRLSFTHIAVPDFTDHNWRHGRARGQSGVCLRLPAALYGVAAGDRLCANGVQTLRVTRATGDQLWFAEALAPALAQAPSLSLRQLQPIESARRLQMQAAAMDYFLATPDLLQLPAAWGRGLAPTAARWGALQRLPATSADGGASVDLLALQAQLRQASLMRLQVACAVAAADAPRSFFLWAQQGPPPPTPEAQGGVASPHETSALAPPASMRWAGASTPMIVPLDSFIALQDDRLPLAELRLQLPCLPSGGEISLQLGIEPLFETYGL